MKSVRRWGWVLVIGSLPSLAVASSSCVTNLSYTPVPREAGPDIPDLTPPNEPPGECALFLSTKDIDFTPIPLTKTVVKSFSVKNLSTASIQVDVSTTNAQFSPKPTTLVLGPSKTQTVEVTARGDAVGRGFAATLTLAIAGGDGGAQCSTTVAVHGDVSDRVRVVGPQPLDLGSVPCKGTPASKELVIDSANADPGTFTAAVAAPFDVNPKDGPLPASDSTKLTVSSGPLDFPAGTITRTLSLALNAGGKTLPLDIDVKAVAVGANLVFKPEILTFTGANDSQTVELSNTGNDAIDVGLSATRYSFSPSTFTLAAFPAVDSKKAVIITSIDQIGAINVIVNVTTSNGKLCAANTLTLKR